MMTECMVAGCNKEVKREYYSLCDGHDWIADFEVKLDDVMQEIWEGNLDAARRALNDAERVLRLRERIDD